MTERAERLPPDWTLAPTAQSRPVLTLLRPDTGPRPTSTWYARYRARLLVADSLIVTTALVVTHLWTFQDELSVVVGGTRVPYWIAAMLLGVTWVIALGAQESRGRQVLGAGAEEYKRVLQGSIAAFGVAAIAAYSTQAHLSRMFFLAALPIGTLMLLASRMAWRQSLARARARGRSLTPCIVLGPPVEAADTIADLRRHPLAGYTPVGVALTSPITTLDRDARTRFDGVELIDVDRLPGTLAATATPFAVVVADGVARQTVRQLAWSLENSAVELMLVSRLTDVAGPRMSISPLPGANLVHVDLPHYSRWKHAQKRAFDVVVSSVALVLLAPVMALIALVVRGSDGGPAIFRHTRIGQDGVPFTMHKFRTMHSDAESKVAELIAAHGGRALLFKIEDDPRVTRVGAVLRKYSLDELPQFWDVLRGHMCIVGPRPQVAREVAEYTDDAHRRLLIKPGITGLWQVNGRSELGPEDAIRLDLRYVENWSLAEDIAIVLRTVKVVLRPRGAY